VGDQHHYRRNCEQGWVSDDGLVELCTAIDYNLEKGHRIIARRPIGRVRACVARADVSCQTDLLEAIVLTPSSVASTGAHSRSLVRNPYLSRVGAPGRALDIRRWSRIRTLVDIGVLYLASLAALCADPLNIGSANRWMAAGFPLLTLAIEHARSGPDQRLAATTLDTWARAIRATSVSAVLAIAAASVLGSVHPAAPALRLWIFASVFLAAARWAMLALRRQAVGNRSLATPTLVVGAGMVGEHLVMRLAGDPRYGLRPVGFLDSDPLPRSDRSAPPLVPVLGGLNDLGGAVALTRARHVILAFSSEPDHILVETVKHCQQLRIDVSLVPRLYESISEQATLDHVGGIPLLSLRPTNPRGWQFVLKHGYDRALASIALLVAAPVMILISAAVRLSSPGPVFFRQRRVGRDGRVFDVLKFRTMRETRVPGEFELPEGCAPGGIEGEDRRTLIGTALRNSSLDELPQLINVVRGDMSLVGPRPERPEFVELFSTEVNRYQDRHRVKSGITGWAQVHGLRGQTSIADRVEWDNYYIQNWSLSLDLRIIALTVAELFRFRG
jgi:exopolysaccharide biosynthesis polyprenyl glycosylphosphotransferase